MRKALLILILGSMFFWLTGCNTSSEFNYVERVIRKQIHPARLKTEFKFSFGPVSLSTAKMFINITETDDEVVGYLREISRVQVGVYKIRNVDQLSELRIPRDAEKKLLDMGWESFVRVRSRSEYVNLMYKQINNRIGSIYVISFDNDELVIVEARGRLDKIIDKAMQEHQLPHMRDI